MLAAQDVAGKCKEVGITALHIKVSFNCLRRSHLGEVHRIHTFPFASPLRSVPLVVTEPSSQDQVLSPLSVVSPVPVCESVELRTLPQPHPTPPGERVVVVVVVSDRIALATYYIWVSCGVTSGRKTDKLEAVEAESSSMVAACSTLPSGEEMLCPFPCYMSIWMACPLFYEYVARTICRG
jgi:hypothetical protein